MTIAAMSKPSRQRLWSGTKRLTVCLLGAWLLVNLLGPWFARELNRVQLFGFPLGFWIAAQGALLAYLLIIVIYVVRMDRMEARYQAESEAEAETGAERVRRERGETAAPAGEWPA